MPMPGDETTSEGHILVVEDDQDVARLIAVILGGAGFSVTVAITAAEAVQVLGREPYDAVVTDVRMPGASGLALLNRLRGTPETKTLPVVVVTGSPGDDLGRTIALVPNTAYLQKPFQAEALVGALRGVLKTAAT